MSGLFGGGKQKEPKVQPPVRMPDPENPALIEADRRKREEIGLRGGRQSTIMTDAPRTTVGGA